MPQSILELSGCVNIVATSIIEQDGNILMVEENKKGIEGRWNFPSGKVDVGETVIEAAIREAKEETGFSIELVGVREVVYEANVSGIGWTIRFVFQGKIVDGEEPSEIAADVASKKWFSKDQLSTLSKEGKLRNEYTVSLANIILSDAPLSPLSAVRCSTSSFAGQLIPANPA
jgi:ADP-ribose pyrophosphatase YjhB (NUDIX family)